MACSFGRPRLVISNYSVEDTSGIATGRDWRIDNAIALTFSSAKLRRGTTETKLATAHLALGQKLSRLLVEYCLL